ncbi:hypothetical protein [Halorussus caseinilyticus]|uniref:Uncharacterized protein n=1 Tax=Halorussus caseinilyticus TaxID=3034025 RepID=A0ABD5WJB8_9EURY|nr:hypothetical protein [Halorussus sp. DT72]
MLPTSLAAAGGAFAGSIVTGIISYYNNRVQQRRQDTRERAGFYIQRKVEILTELHEKLSECHAILSPYISHKKIENKRFDISITEEQIREVNNLTKELRKLAIKSQLYLTEEEKTAVQVGLMTLNYAIAEADEERQFEQKHLQQGAQEAVEQIDDDVELSNYYENIYTALNAIKSEVNEPIEAVRQPK